MISVGNLLLTMISNVVNLTAGLDVLERQKTPTPVYIGRMPSFFSVCRNIDRGVLLWLLCPDSRCPVLMNSVGYYADWSAIRGDLRWPDSQ